MFELIAGHDPRDATEQPRPVPAVLAALDAGTRACAWPCPRTTTSRRDAEVKAAVREAAACSQARGARVVRDAPARSGRGSWTCATSLARAESAAIHARVLRERPHELGAAVRARLEIGCTISAHDYLQAGRLRARLAREFVEEVFGEVDAMLAPAIPEPRARSWRP